VIYVNGGGYYNTKLLQNIRMLTKMSVKSIEMLGIKPELKEALLFSVLANEFVTGNGFKSNRGKRKVQFGKLSLP
jgi:anhydro-N-acetylmuramic acid kinase